MNKPTLENIKNLAFLSNESYKTAVDTVQKGKEKEQMSFKQPLINPATNSSFEVIDQKRDNNGFAAMLVKNIDNNNANNIKYAIVYRGTDGINDISTNPTALLDMRRLLLTHTLELRLSLYRDFALHLCGLSFLCHR